MPLREKIETIATRVYGADGVDFAPAATKALAEYEALRATATSRSAWPRPTSRSPTTRTSRAARPASASRSATSGSPPGAGFIYPLAGDMRTMPGLPSHPAGEKIDIDADGNVVGLF